MWKLTRISDETKQRIRDFKEQGYPNSIIAQRLGVSMSSVQKYLPEQNKQEGKDGQN